MVSLENSASGYAPGPGPGYAPKKPHRKPGPWTTGRNLATHLSFPAQQNHIQTYHVKYTNLALHYQLVQTFCKTGQQ